jgi:hypothetical protein
VVMVVSVPSIFFRMHDGQDAPRFGGVAGVFRATLHIR